VGRKGQGHKWSLSSPLEKHTNTREKVIRKKKTVLVAFFLFFYSKLKWFKKKKKKRGTSHAVWKSGTVFSNLRLLFTSIYT
jgi:hypothetical protein